MIGARSITITVAITAQIVIRKSPGMITRTKPMAMPMPANRPATMRADHRRRLLKELAHRIVALVILDVADQADDHPLVDRADDRRDREDDREQREVAAEDAVDDRHDQEQPEGGRDQTPAFFR